MKGESRRVTLKDYERALERFVEDVRALGDDLESVLVHGSLACGTVEPGRSDVMDAHLVLRAEALTEKETFYHALEVMLKACGNLSGSGIPFHPFGHLARDELGFLQIAPFSTYPFVPFTEVVHGEDVLPEARPSAASRELGRTYFFEARSAAYFHLGRLLGKAELSPDEQSRLLSVLTTVRKSLAMACLALGMPLTAIDKHRVAAQLEEVVPGLDTAVLDRIDRLRASLEVTAGEPIGRRGRGRAGEETQRRSGELREVGREAARFLDRLHAEILRRWKVGEGVGRVGNADAMGGDGSLPAAGESG